MTTHPSMSDLLEFLDDMSSTHIPPPTTSAPPPPLDNPPDLLMESESMPPRELVREPTMSRVLMQLPAAQRPPVSLACGTCPAAIWMSGAATLQVFCMVTRTMAWTRDEQLDIQVCDGREQALLARAAG